MVILNTAAFEHIKSDINQWVEKNPYYTIHSETMVLNFDETIAQDVLRIKWCSDSKALCTINLYRTTCKVMINGSDFKIFEKRSP